MFINVCLNKECIMDRSTYDQLDRIENLLEDIADKLGISEDLEEETTEQDDSKETDF